MELNWIDGFTITVRIQPDNAVLLSANKEGLLSLANHMIALAESETPCDHIHLDQYNYLEDGSTELIIEKVE